MVAISLRYLLPRAGNKKNWKWERFEYIICVIMRPALRGAACTKASTCTLVGNFLGGGGGGILAHAQKVPSRDLDLGNFLGGGGGA